MGGSTSTSGGDVSRTECSLDSGYQVKGKLCPCHCKDRMALCFHKDTTAVQRTDSLEQRLVAARPCWVTMVEMTYSSPSLPHPCRRVP